MLAAEPLVRKSDGAAADDVGAFRQRDFGARGVLFEGFRERDQVTNKRMRHARALASHWRADGGEVQKARHAVRWRFSGIGGTRRSS